MPPPPDPRRNQTPAPTPAPVPPNHTPAPTPAPVPQNHTPAPTPAPAPQNHTPAPTPAPAPQNHTPAPTPAPAPQNHTPAPTPAPPAPTPAPTPAPDSSLLHLRLFSPAEAQATGAVCLDGTPAGYYLRKAPDDLPSPDWIIYLPGGGNCKHRSTCRQRSKGTFGSSRKWSPTKSHESYHAYPVPWDLRHWNIVEIPYCSGDSFSGTRGWYKDWGVHVAGHHILSAVVNDLKTAYGVGAGAPLGRVLLTGDSSGGHGVYINADWLQGQMPGWPVLAAPIAGFYYPNVTDYQTWLQNPEGGWEANDTFWTQGVENQHWQSYLPTPCVARQPANSTRRLWCVTSGYISRYMAVPVFAIENQFDPTKANSLGCKGCRISGLSPATKDGAEFNGTEEIRFMQYYARRLAAEVAALATRPQNGAFVPSCYDHENDLFNVSRPNSSVGPRGAARLAGDIALGALARWVEGRGYAGGAPPPDAEQRAGWLWRDACAAGCVPCDAHLTAHHTAADCASPWRSCSGVAAGAKCPPLLPLPSPQPRTELCILPPAPKPAPATPQPPPPPPAPPASCSPHAGVDCYGGTLGQQAAVGSAHECCALCRNFTGCTTWTWYSITYKSAQTPCYFKSGCSAPKKAANCTSGGDVGPATPPPATPPPVAPPACRVCGAGERCCDPTLSSPRQLCPAQQDCCDCGAKSCACRPPRAGR